MKKRPLRLLLLMLFITTGIALIYLIQSISPTMNFHLGTVSLSIKIPVFILIFTFVFSIVTFFFRRLLHGILSATLITLYLIIRSFGFINIIYVILLIALFAALEFAFTGKPKKKQEA